jgi:hypothetical protein
MVYYIIACEYHDINNKSYINNLDPIIWSNDILLAKKFYSKDDMINELRFNLIDLYNLKNNYDNVKDIIYMKFENNIYIHTKGLLK